MAEHFNRLPALRRAVFAVEVDDAVVYVYGWAEEVSHDMEREEVVVPGRRFDRRLGPPRYTTTVEWAEPPTQSMRYPTDADFARALPANRQLPAAAATGLPEAAR